MLKVLKPGLWTSIQDQGRVGYKHFGVPSAGCMDQYSADLANSLLNNPMDAAVLENTLIGPALEFQLPSRICICGADMSPHLNKQKVANNVAIDVHAGDVLSFAHLNYGARSYVAIQGGFQTEFEMDSQSYYHNITSQAKIEKSDLIDYFATEKPLKEARAAVKIDMQHFQSPTIECLPGPEFSLLNSEEKSLLTQEKFSLSKNCTRMGFQLKELLECSLASILSSAVIPGTVQLTPSGQLIVLMRDCQTTGGYPRVLQLTEMAINQLAQKKPGDTFQFSLLGV